MIEVALSLSPSIVLYTVGTHSLIWFWLPAKEVYHYIEEPNCYSLYSLACGRRAHKRNTRILLPCLSTITEAHSVAMSPNEILGWESPDDRSASLGCEAAEDPEYVIARNIVQACGKSNQNNQSAGFRSEFAVFLFIHCLIMNPLSVNHCNYRYSATANEYNPLPPEVLRNFGSSF